MYRSIIVSLFLFVSVSFQTFAGRPDFKGNNRQKLNFNSEWLLHVGDLESAQIIGFNDRNWKKITLPRAFNEDEAFKLAIDKHTTSIMWYRKHFRIPSSARGKKVFLEFEGIRFGGEFFINGKSIGMHENGVMAAGFDITDYLNAPGRNNVIAVRIDNSWSYREQSTNSTWQWNDRNFNANYGGIPKNVFMYITDKLYQTLPLYSNLKTTGTYIYAREINTTRRSATIHAETEVRNEHNTEKEFRYEVHIVDMEGRLVKHYGGQNTTLASGATEIVKAQARLDNINFWSWGHGYLYDVYTTLYLDNKPVDVVRTRTGFRKTEFRNGIFKLNDRVMQLKGYAQRTSNEWPSVGMSVPAWLSDYSNGLMVESNANLVRWMHVAPWKQDVESCDRVGLLQAMPAGDAERDVEGRRWEQRVELMRDAIIYNRNNPSIIFYEAGNKGISEAHMAEMVEMRDLYDPWGGRAMGSREMLDSQIAEWGGEMLYINKSGRLPFWATEYCRDEALRKYWDDYSYPYHKDGDGPLYRDQDASAYNRNQDSYAVELVRRWFDYFRVRPGTGRRVSSGGTNIIFSDTNTHYRGEENYRRSGEVDAMRIPKDGFFAHQVMWDGWVDIENYRTHIVGHWNYKSGVQKDIFVVSSGESVELFVNGKSKGKGVRKYHFLYTFPQIVWEPGTIEAVSYDALGKEVSRHTLYTAGEPHAIKLTLMQAPDGFKADGADLVLVEVEVVDKDGRRCPLANHMISYDLRGPAEWRGGIAQGPDNYILAKEFPVECGVNRMLIRSTNKSGRIQLHASAEGLSQASLQFNSIPVKQTHGISEYISGEHQPSQFKRPAIIGGESFRESRRQVEIIDAITEINQDKARNSYDDNERTEWTNDGRLRTGWITYELERDAVVSEIDLKLTGFRMRSYPIQIFVDDIEVFRGETDKNLGYIGIPVKPTKGRFVKIQLIGLTTDNDVFNQIVELAGHIELDLFRDPNAADARGQLRIIEIDVYEAVE